jgi:hypothetical protein
MAIGAHNIVGAYYVFATVHFVRQATRLSLALDMSSAPVLSRMLFAREIHSALSA